MQKNEAEAEIVDVSEYLSLKLLGRDAKVKVLGDAFDATKWAGKSSLFSVSNKLGWFVAGTPTGLVASPLAHLRELQTNATGDGPAPLEPKRRVELSGSPYFINFATSHTKLVVVVRTDEDWVLEIFGAEDICKEGSGDVKPLHSFPLGKEDIIDMQPNPSDDSDLVAILRGRKSSSSCLDMINIASASRVTSWGAANKVDEGTAFTCLSWSVRGKQIVVGTRGGDLAQFTPEGERKQTIPSPPSQSSPQAVVSVLWLENTVFHVVYGNPDSDPSDPTHEYEVFNVIFEPKAKSTSYIKFTDPAPPFGVASRLACRHYARLVGWEPTKHLIFVADGPSTDVGAVACLNPSEAEGKPTPWATLEVDETSRISLPMDDDMNETSIMGIDLDLTSTDPISNSQEAGDGAAPSPPSPILHLYTSAGLIISYHVLNSQGGKYPGMGIAEVPSVVSPSGRPTTPPSTTPAKPPAFAGFGTGSSAFGATPVGAVAQTPATPAFGASSFGSTTPAGAPAFGVSGFGASTTPAKPNPFGQASTTPATTPAFGQTSAFGTTSAFGGGFGKFAAAPTTTPASAPPAGSGFAGFGSKPATFGTSGGTNIFAGSETMAPKSEGGLSAFGSSAFGEGTTPSKPAGGFAGFGTSTVSPAATPKAEPKPRDPSAELDSPSAGPVKPLQIDDDQDVSPPASPGGLSDGDLDVGGLGLGGGGGKKLPAGLNLSDDEEEHDPTETPSKPPPSTSAFAGFGKPSAFGNTAGGGAFAIPSSTTGVIAPASGFGAFGSKPSTPSPGFGFGTSTKSQDDKSGQPAKPAFGGGSAFGSTSAFGSSTAFGAAGKPAFGAAPTFGTSSTLGATSTPAFGAPSAFGAAASPAFGAPSSFGVAAKPASDTPAESPAPKTGGFSAFAAKPGESKGPVGFAGFGDAAKNKSTGGFGAFAGPGDTKSGGFAGFGDAGKKNIFGEKPAEPAKSEELDKREEVVEDKPAVPEEEVQESKDDAKPETTGSAPRKSAFGLMVSSPPPKPKAPSPPSEPEPSSETPSKIPVPKASLLDRLSPKPEPEPEESNNSGHGSPSTAPLRSGSTTPGSPAHPPSPPTTVPPQTTSAPIPSPFGLGKPPLKSFGSAPLRSSPLASPPVTRENEAKQEVFAKATPVAPPALTPKTSSSSLTGATAADSTAKTSSTGFFGFGKPAEDSSKETKAGAEQWPSSFSGAMKGVGPASVTAGSPPVIAPSAPKPAVGPTLAAPATRTGSPFSAPPAPAPTSLSPGPTAAASPPAPTTGAPPAAKQSLFGAPSGSPVPAPTFSGFGSKPAPGPSFSFASASPTPASFGAPSTPVPPTSTPPPAPSTGFGGFKPLAAPPTAASGAGTPALPAATVPSSTPAASSSAPPALWSNVEVEFNKLLEQMANELGKMRQDTAALQQRQALISRVNIPPQPTIQSMQNPAKWGLGDLPSLKQVTGLVAREVEPLKGLNKDFAAQMTELQPGAEKVQAKRNEIARYIKAKKDPKYTRLLKSRTSSPEHIESQTKLRKSLQIVRERTRQLETFMATQRSRIQKQKEGRREFKVPSIDTINRTMRNIDSALSQKSDDIALLTARVDRMKLKAPKRKASTSGTVALVLPPAENEKIKRASAAALNMERSSIRLKTALLQARKETPLNTSAVGAPTETKPAALAKVLPPRAPPVPSTPSSSSIFAPPTPAAASTPAPSFPAFGQPSTPSPFTPAPAKTPMVPGGFVLPPVTPVSLPSFSPLGKDEFHVTSGYEQSSRRAEKSRMHGSSAKFNKTPSPNISRTSESTTPGKPFFGVPPPPAESPSITPAKSFFGVGPAPPLFSGERKPQPLPVFSVPPTPPKTKGFNFFQTPAEKAAGTGASTSTPPPLAKWAQSASPAESPKSNKAAGVKKEPKDDEEEEDDEEEGSEGQHSGEDDYDEDEDDDWEPGEEDDEDDEEVSDGVPEDEAEEEDQTARV